MRKIFTRLFLGLLIVLGTTIASAQISESTDPDWSEGFLVPENGRSNPYNLTSQTLAQWTQKGKLHALIYPVTVTGALPPFRPVKNFVETPYHDPLHELVRFFFRNFTQVKSVYDLFSWVGMHPYPKETDTGVYSVPYPDDKRPDYPMGFGLITRNEAEGFTVSCAHCHTGNLFGKSVLGLSNRFAKANKSFVRAKQFLPFVNSYLFGHSNGASPEEINLLRETKINLRSVGVKMPLELGLDTSIAQVALSLNRRNLDADATKSQSYQKNPRPDWLDTHPADSKPAVWWNLKYKNRWLSDGSVVSGNPIFTNILWNEVGRGTDLQVLSHWLASNSYKINQLTAAVFSSEAPKFTDFFSEDHFQIQNLKTGERLFNQTCAKCHGTYEKMWNQPNADRLPLAQQISTVKVRYLNKTPVINVGTDANRYLGMKSLEALNNLRLSKIFATKVVAQKGYVPPPLVGIWARWPYFHNNSVPSLCAVLTKAADRPKKFRMLDANDKDRDFDRLCNGYPIHSPQLDSLTGNSQFIYNTNKEGTTNTGHDEGIFLRSGEEIFSTQEKADIILFLQTL